MNRALKGKGTIAFLGGAPGQPSSLANLEALKAALVKYPGLTLIEPDMQPISNDAATARQVMSALLAKDGRIDGIITDNGTVSAPIIDAYEAAGMEPPALAVSASSNGLNCTWDAKKNFPFYSTDGNHMGSLVALRRVLSEITKVPFNEPDAISSWTVVDTLDGKDPVCDSTASPDADWSTSLTKAEMKALFK
jgi:ribose transport system substrate-binding protein